MPRYNLARNPAVGTDLTGWLSSPGATRVTGQTVGNTGRTTAAQITTGSGAYSAYLSGGNVPTTPAASGGRPYSWVAWVYSSVNRIIRPGLIRWNGASPVAAQYASDVTLTAGTWTQIRGSVTLPTGGSYTALRVHIDLPSAGTAGQLRLSAVRIEQITDLLLTYADGSTPDGRWGWDGTPDSSSSTQSDAISATVSAQITSLGFAGSTASARLDVAAVEVVADTAVPAPVGSVATGVDPATLALAIDRAVGAADRADVTPAPVGVTFGPTVGFPAPSRYPSESDYPVDVGESYDATVSTVALARAEARVAALVLDVSGTVATTAVSAPAVAAAVALDSGTAGGRVGPVPAPVLVAPAVPNATATVVAVADVYPPVVLVAVSAEDAESRSVYSIPAVGVLVALRTLGALVPRGNLALYTLDALLDTGTPGLFPDPALTPGAGLLPRRTTVTGVDVAALTIPDLDAAATVTDLDAIVAQAELDATVRVAEIAATADTRGT